MKRAFQAALTICAANILNYLAWLGWDREWYTGSDGEQHGPYREWQVIGLVLVIIVIVAIASWKRHSILAIVVTTFTVLLCFSVVATTIIQQDDGLWVVGAAMVFIGALAGTTVLATIVAMTRKLVRHARSTAGD